MLARRFEEQVRKKPEHIAVKTNREVLTYRELNNYANSVANKILQISTTSHHQVAILFEHGSDMIVGMIGALKAKKVYVPFDPSYPETRLEYMLEDSESSMIITNNKNLELARRLIDKVGKSIELLNVDELDKSEMIENPKAEVGETEIAYILYTSGSTGRPKGVVQSHRNVLHFIKNYIKDMEITSEDRLSLFSAFSHDAAVMDIYSGLLGGATLYPLNIREEGNIDILNDWLIEEGITIWHSVPTLYRYYINTLETKADRPKLKYIVLGGEAVLKQDIANFKKYFQDAIFVNLYGQTESSYNSCFKVSAKDTLVRLTLGEPVEDTEIVVINEEGEEADPLETGEIVIVSDHVALGYWKDAEKTEKVFLDLEEVGKTYWTGDLGRTTYDGDIEFIGRKDHQVKVRGYRVELTEIEDCLLTHESIKEAVVLDKEDQDGNKMLMGYITAPEELKGKELRQFLLRKLPDYMVPSHILQIEKMPLTPNGKLDRKALLEYKFNVTEVEEYEAPRNPIEATLVDIWKESLGVEGIGINHNFFELGGHSLKATAMVAKIHQAFNVLIPLKEIFKSPTIKSLAEIIGGLEENTYIDISPVEVQEFYETSSAQKRLYLLQQMDKESLAYNVLGVMTIAGKLDIDRLQQAFKGLIMRHEAFRTSFEIQGESIVQRIEKDVVFEIDYKEITSEKETEDEKIEGLISEFVRSHDLSTAPLIRVGLIKLLSTDEDPQPQRYVLIYDLHHIISDGVSMGILIKDFIQLYQGIELPNMKLQYKDFAHWQNKLFESEEIQQQKNYWKESLKGELPQLRMPIDYSRKERQTFAGQAVSFDIPEAMVQKMKLIAQEKNTSLNILLMSLYNILLNKYTQQKDLLVGITVSGRRHRDLENVVGAFINFLPIRSQVSLEDSFIEFLETQNNLLTEAYSHQDYPFDKIVEDVGVKREANRNPIFSTMLIFHNEVENNISSNVDGLLFESYQYKNQISTLDFKLDAFTGPKGTIKCTLEYNTGLFKPETMVNFTKHFLELIKIVVEDTKIKISDINLFTGEEESHLRTKQEKNDPTKPLKVSVTASFTADPVMDYINWWSNKFGVEVEGRLAPYNQVFQTILDQNNSVFQNSDINIILLRFEDWIRDTEEEHQARLLKGSFEQLQGIMKTLNREMNYLVGIFPVSKEAKFQDSVVNMIQEMNKKWRLFLKDFENITLLDFTEIEGLYGIKELFDPIKDENGHMPFTDDFYAAMGTMMARKIAAIKLPPFKVIAVDCDNTLWGGVVGEDGPLGIRIDETYGELQRLLVQKQEEGMLIVLLSKNNEADVWEAFHQNPNMILKKEHIAGYRINWQPKSQNLQELALELNLGLDSFIFIDDSGMETTELMTNKPEVLTLRLPEDQGQIPMFLKHIWALDRLKVTEEDKKRTKLYLVEQQRKQFQETTTSLQDFLKELKLRMVMKEITEEQIPRVSQLTQRTNQFNLSTRRRSEADIREIMKGNNKICWTVQVADKFGEYGLTGVVIGEIEEKIFHIDTFLLSCRVLGRGIEDAILSELRGFCKEKGIVELRAEYIPTPKNKPVQEFVDRVMTPELIEDTGNIIYRCSVDEILENVDYITCNEEVAATLVKENTTVELVEIETQESSYDIDDEGVVPQVLKPIDYWYVDLAGVGKLKHDHYLLPLMYSTGKRLLEIPVYEDNIRIHHRTFEAPRNAVEEKLADIWMQVLKVDTISIHDNFFELGGHSLKAMSVISGVHKVFNVEINILELFSVPTIKELGEYIQQQEQKEYMEISPVGEKEYYSLSSAQKRIFILQQMEQEATGYNMPGAVILEGVLDAEKVEKVFLRLIERHESLRTTFEIVEGEPVQYIQKDVDFSLQYLEGEESKLDEILQGFVKAFDLTKAPLLRVGLVKLHQEKYVLVFDMHHIISDGVSMGILIKEFAELYGDVDIKPLRIQYKDYSEWQKEMISSGKMEEHKNYWLKQFEGEIPVLNLRGDYPRPAIQRYEGNRLNFKIGEDITNSLKTLCSQTGTTMYMLLLSAYNVLLSKYSGQEDIIVGSPIAGRPHGDLKGIMGMFVNTLAMRNFPMGEKTFKEFLSEVKQNALGAYQHQDYQFEELVEQLNLKRDFSRNPLFDVMFTMQNMDMTAQEIEGLKIAPYTFKNTTSKFDMTLTAVETEAEINISLSYSIHIFNSKTIERLYGHLINLLRQISENIDMKISEISLISQEEKQMLLEEFNNTAVDFPRDKTLHQLFENQVMKTPNKTAIVFGEEKITYGELNYKANSLARSLRNRGVKANSIVGIVGEASIEMMIAILAVLKAGGGYVPVDKEFPNARRSYILNDSGAELVLTTMDLVKDVREDFEGDVLDIQEGFGVEDAGENLDCISRPEDLVYTIYTSGTTGKGKGVLISHINLVNYTSWFIRESQLGEGDKTLLLSSFAFDLGYTTLFSSMITGAELHLIQKDTYLQPEKLLRYIQEKGISFMKLTPSHYSTLVESDGFRTKLQSLRLILMGGEEIKPRDVEKTYSIYKNLEIMNHYGPTETTIGTIAQRINVNEIEEFIKAPTIGKPISNAQAYILDEFNCLQPIGVPGELCISGEGVGKGYLNRPDLTREKFIQVPDLSRGQIYKTGDLARWLSNGKIEFLGRIDHQVKIRGYRIELGEIENQLMKYPAVEQAIVISEEDDGGDKYLCGYVVADKKIEISELRQGLLKELPEYMIPSYILQIDEVPLTPNGKIDRKALPKPDGNIPTGMVEYEAPRNDVEEILVGVWQEILGIEGIGISHNFFELGGHSLKAINMVSKIHRAFNVEISLREIFKAPTIKEISELIKATETRDYLAIEVAEEKEFYAVSPAQLRLYTLQQLDLDSLVYNMPRAVVLEGNLDAKRVEETFRQLIQRHESLRTSFKLMDGVPVQYIQPQVNFQLQQIEAEEEELEEIMKDFIKVFDLNKGPFLRVALVKIKEEKHLLMVDMHHIISDGVSVGVLIREFAELYSGGTLEALRLQYKDYSEWQKELLKAGKIEEQKEYWLEQFSGEIPVLNLMGDYPRPAIQSFDGERLSYRINQDMTDGMRSLCRTTGTTMYMLLLSAYNILLSKYSGQEDIIVGSPIAGRPHGDLSNIMGMFVNTLAMRNYPKGDMTFKEFLTEVKKNSLGAFENQDYQFEALVENLNLTRDISRNPLFDVMFTMQNMDMSALEVEGLTIKPFSYSNTVSKFDMTLLAIEGDSHINIGIEYATKIFKKDTIERFYLHLENVIKQIIENPTIKLSDVELVTEEEKYQLLNDFNNTKVDYPRQKTIHQLFEEQVKERPDSIALVEGEKQLTYRQLNGRANQVARLLVEKGVKPDTIVGLMVERSLDMIIGMMGILKAGGAYLPIDHGYPQQRIDFLLQDSGTEILLTQGHLEYGGDFQGEKLLLEDEAINHQEDENLGIINSSNDLAYIIYTSGSTGKPKGVMLEHHGIVSLNNTWRNRLGITEEDHIIQFASCSFDASVWEIFMALLNGTKLHIISTELAKDYRKLEQYIDTNSITTITLPPIYLGNLDSNKVKSLKRIISAGSELSPQLAKKWGSKLQLVNAYGPTETTICATMGSCQDIGDVTNVPIGGPILNTEVYILRDGQYLQPIGVVGELWVGGEGLARGYLNRPELTEESFINNPFKSGERIYRTGDMGRWLSDGRIEFLGRVDHQVKIRGFRIELGEIENQLLKHPSIKEAVVLAKKSNEGSQELCGYIVGEKQLTVAEIREHIGKELPDYMIPTYILQLDEMPLNANGKIDKKALPEADGTHYRTVEYVAPENQVEEILANIWQENLGVEKVGVYDNYFELGGHSLRATVMMTKVHQALNVEVPLKELFKAPTIKGMSQYIMKAENSLYTSIEAVEEKEYYATSSAQKRLYTLQQFDKESIGYNIPGAMILEGPLDVEKLEETFKTLVKRHEAFRTSFKMKEGELVQFVHREVDFSLELKEAREEDIEGTLKDFVKSFDLSKAPLLRVGLMKLAAEKHILCFDMHHIISDGVSMGILVREFSKIYKGMTLEPLKIQYKDYSEGQKTLITSSKMEGQKQFWLHQFEGEVPVLNLMGDFPRPAIQSFEGDRLSYRLEEEITKKLNEICRNHGVTMYMMLLSAFNVLLSKYSGQEDIVIGSPIAGRYHGDLKNVMGVFVNTLAMRNYPEKKLTFKEFLTKVKINSLDAYGNQDFPFEELVENLGLRRDMSRNPLFDIVFTMQNMDISATEIEGLSIKPYGFKNTISKFDITLSAVEIDNTISLGIEYATRIFKKETIENLYRHLENILKQITVNPEIQLGDIELVTEEEREKLLKVFNNTKVDYPKNQTIHRLFEMQVERTPDDIAVIFENQRITYRELNNRGNQLARRLINAGVKRDTVVPIMAEKSIELIIGILGILKSGGAYLPIDPEYPTDRIEYMISDSGGKILLAQSGVMKKVNFEGAVIFLDEKGIYEGDTSNLSIETFSDSIAYLIYTSGSTGKPKGVAVHHQSLNNFINTFYHKFDKKVDSTDRCLSLTNISFDVCVAEIFLPITFGASLVLFNTEGVFDINQVVKIIQEKSITFTYIPPSLLKEVAERLLPVKDQIQLNKMLVGVEPIKDYTMELFLQLNPNMKIINGYGPTEATICATMYEYGTEEATGRNIPIGKPLFNTEIYIVDSTNNLQPVGIVGEICIAGDGLAQGYLNRPEITSEKFVDNPFKSGERMYRTGDLGRWLPDGNIEFIGRVDHQVKIRGYRIELGEVESHLKNNGAVDEAVVIAKEDTAGVKYLCGYIVAKGEIDIPQLKGELSRALPSYMIPSHILQLEKMPLTSNGKIDRRALPEPEDSVGVGAEYEAPRNITEEKLVTIWQDILHVKGIGVNDNFFELGGHSLKATAMVAAIHKEFNIEIPLMVVFKAPTIRELAEHMKASDISMYSEIEVVEGKEYYVASPAQRRIYALQQFDKESISYNMPGAVMLEDRLDIGKLEETFKKLIERHEALRTSFKIVDGEPVQYIHPKIDFKLQWIEAREEELREILRDFVKPFDLEDESLLRVGLIKMLEDKHLLIFDMHHIISDGVSMDILIREFADFYSGKTLDSLRLQYKDYSHWQNQLISTGKIQHQKEYWLQQFKGEIPVLNLMGDYQRPAIQNYEGSRLGYQLDEGLTADLRGIARKTGTTLYMIMLSAFNVLLSKYGGQEDIIIGSPIAGRPHGDLNNIIGVFINTLAMRNYPAADKTLGEFLKEVKLNALEAFENQDYQFEELVEALNIKRDLSRNPLFDVMFNYQNMESGELTLEGLNIKPYGVENNISKFDLTLGVVEGQGIHLSFEYSTRLFKPTTIDGFYRHFVNILKHMAEDLDYKIVDLPLITEEEQRLLLTEFNDTQVDYSAEKTIHRLFEEQAERTPHRVALKFNDLTLTYSQLNGRSNQLARILKEKGVEKDVLVGIMVKPSLEMLVGILAILKAGGAYLPIDPQYPTERVNYMLEDSGSKLLLTEGELKELVNFEGEILLLEEDGLYQGDEGDLREDVDSQSLAYVIYTSGSTGKPKGVMIQHNSATNFIKGMTDAIDFNETKTILALTTMSFDIFFLESLLPLTQGLRVVIADQGDQLNPVGLKELMEREQISMLQATPSRIKMILEDTNNNFNTSYLREIMVGGEALPPQLLKELQKRTQAKIYNMYGPTETTIWSVVADLTESKEVTIGKPVANTQIYIVDANNHLQPVGVAGELCIGGSGLSRGYLNKPELTSGKFVDNPFIEGEKMYKTGDMARWRSDGSIEFLGRRDYQVKIRGYRIELEEIENHLLNHEVIKAAVVLASDETSGQVLMGYFTGERELTVGEIRDYLRRSLPEYMIPTYLLQLKEMPLTPNGKVDRRALLELKLHREVLVEYQGPRNEIEEKLVEIWQEVLGKERVGIHDDFFELGGNSINILRISSEIEARLNISFPVSHLFINNTIEKVAISVENEELLKDLECVVKLNNSVSDRNIFILHGMDGDIYYYKDLARSIDDEYQVYGIQARGLTKNCRHPKTPKEMMRQYLEEIKKVQPEGPYIIAGYCAGAIIGYDLVRQLEDSGDMVKKLILLDEGVFLPTAYLNLLEFKNKHAQSNVLGRIMDQLLNYLLDVVGRIRTVVEYKDIQNSSEDTGEVNGIDRGKLKRNVYRLVTKQLLMKRKPTSSTVIIKSKENNSPLISLEMWQGMVDGDVKVVESPGNHDTMLKKPQAAELSKIIKDVLKS